ncbi:MAG: rhomboid family intramembrane serine protease [Acidimicrobiia bacterium]|nr:rhomboid family intramembrane serine protease [Acidimicrobiia bacterium]
MIPLKDYNPTTRRAWITLGLILINVFVYFLVQPHGQGNIDPQSEAVREAKFTYAHAAIPCEVTHGHPLTLAEVQATVNNNDQNACADASDPSSPEVFPHKNVYLAILYSMFLHASLLHIAGNMLYFWIFGNNIEDRMGWIGYPIFYLVAGLVAAASQFAVQPNSTVPVVGASGAIAGVMGAYLVLFPRVRIRALIFIIPADIPAYVLLGFWFLFQFFTSPTSGVAWVAHVGGFLFGALIALIFRNHLRPPRTRPNLFYGAT